MVITYDLLSCFFFLPLDAHVDITFRQELTWPWSARSSLWLPCSLQKLLWNLISELLFRAPTPYPLARSWYHFVEDLFFFFNRVACLGDPAVLTLNLSPHQSRAAPRRSYRPTAMP